MGYTIFPKEGPTLYLNLFLEARQRSPQCPPVSIFVCSFLPFLSASLLRVGLAIIFLNIYITIRKLVKHKSTLLKRKKKTFYDTIIGNNTTCNKNSMPRPMWTKCKCNMSLNMIELSKASFTKKKRHVHNRLQLNTSNHTRLRWSRQNFIRKTTLFSFVFKPTIICKGIQKIPSMIYYKFMQRSKNKTSKSHLFANRTKYIKLKNLQKIQAIKWNGFYCDILLYFQSYLIMIYSNKQCIFKYDIKKHNK